MYNNINNINSVKISELINLCKSCLNYGDWFRVTISDEGQVERSFGIVNYAGLSKEDTEILSDNELIIKILKTIIEHYEKGNK